MGQGQDYGIAIEDKQNDYCFLYDTLDGHKLVLEGGGFIALRASGTEPLVRCYLDATDAASMAELQEAARKLIAS